MKNLPYTICVDFDLTLANTTWPEIHGLNIGADGVSPKDVLNEWHDAGHKVIIWTCREGESKAAAERFLQEQGVKYHHINENCEHRTSFFQNDSRKLGAEIYIDDKCLMGLPPWGTIREIVKEKIKAHYEA